MNIPRAHVERVCRIGQRARCCRYLLAGPKGFECAKHTQFKRQLDARVVSGTICAQGNNCPGEEKHFIKLDS